MADCRATNVLTVDVEEYYHGVEFGAALHGDGLRHLPSRVVAQTFRLLDLLDERGARGTFFTLGVVARHQPRLVRAIAERGHEIASHGWDHTPVFRLGADGFELASGSEAVRRARRFKSAAELAEVRRVADATCAAFRRVAALLAASEPRDGTLHLDGEPLRVGRLKREIALLFAADGLSP